ncbi:MAG: gliding motility-associated C-terminal domain-containing protein, partial [Bacteroidota bacterium]|nr:gliding motility-associated C-terminal domain-containing protein [Bacteroidota bacterium]
GNVPTVGSGFWSVISGTASISSPTMATSNITGISTGTTILQWSISNGTCATSTSTMFIQVDALPTTAIAGSNQTLCANNPTTTLNGNVPTVGTGLWTVLSGIASISSPTLATSNITGISTGTTILQWSISNGTCAVSTSTMFIQVDALPTTALAGPNQTLCASNPTTTLNGNIPTVGTGAWTVLSGTASIANPTLATSNITGISTGTTILQWSISNGTCAVSSSTMLIQVDALPTTALAGSNQTLCASNPTTTLNGNVPTVGTSSWTVLSGTASISSPTVATSNITGISTGTTILQWSISNGTCAVSSSSMLIQVDALPTTALAGINQTLCANNPTTTLNGNVPTVGSGFWSVISGTASISSPTMATSNITGISTGTTILQWSISNGTCAVSSSSMVVQVDAIPTLANAGINQTICASTFTLAGNLPLNGNGFWTILSGPAALVNPNLNNSLVNNLNVGINSFIWTISNGFCLPSLDTVDVFVANFPDVAVTISDFEICETDTINISANSPINGSGSWSVIQGGGNINNNLANTTFVTSFVFGDNIFRWVITNSVCPVTFDDLKITVYQKPSIADAGMDQLVFSDKASLNAVSPAIGIGKWSSVNTNLIFGDINAFNSDISNLENGINTVIWETTNGVCPVSSDFAIITRDNVVIPSGFSPNGDNINDYFFIKGIESLGLVQLTVFNRWGNIVYENREYKNNWNGMSMDANELSDDTYYFVLKSEFEKEIKGYVFIKRK